MNQSKPESSSAIIIIGSGLAGYTLVREIRKIDKAIPITLITREPGYFYSKPMLSTAFASKKEAAQLISTATEAMAACASFQAPIATKCYTLICTKIATT